MGIPKRHKSGFTIVELAVIISVIGILAAITVVGYGAWQKRTIENVVKTDLLNVAAAMDSARNFGNTYPTTFPNSFKPSSNVVLEMMSPNSTNYCINAYSLKDTSVFRSIQSSDSQNPRDSLCTGASGATIGGTPPPPATGVNIAPLLSGWTLSGGATYNTSTNELTLGANGVAASPKVRVNGVGGVNINAEFYTSQQSSHQPFQPQGGWYNGTAYFTSDGTTPATNTWGYQGNGCATRVNINNWTVNPTSNCGYALGNNVYYFQFFFYGSAYGYTSTDLKVRNVSFVLY